MMNTCKSLAEELDSLHNIGESYWHLRSKANELRDGDKISKYFHHKASSRRRRNTIKGLYDGDGKWLTNKVDLERIIRAYYNKLFATSSPTGFSAALDGIGMVVTDEIYDKLE